RAALRSRLVIRPLRWLTVALGLLCTATGALLTLSPFASLAALAVLVATGLILTGLVELARSGAAPDTSLSVVTGLGWLAAGVAVAPRPDAFYTPSAALPATPGVLLRGEPSSRAAPPGAQAWRILYTTTRDDHTPAVASAVVLAATGVPAGPRPVLAWAHGATGIAPACAPSLLADPLGSGAMPGLDQALARGWVVVATDYPGLGTGGPHPFLIGQGEARSVLDAVRAARHLPGVTLGDRTVVWGHSQGGNAALWTGILAPGYAPDAGVVGVAALAPGSELV